MTDELKIIAKQNILMYFHLTEGIKLLIEADPMLHMSTAAQEWLERIEEIRKVFVKHSDMLANKAE